MATEKYVNARVQTLYDNYATAKTSVLDAFHRGPTILTTKKKMPRAKNGRGKARKALLVWLVAPNPLGITP
jgi:hypothetical protein